MHFTKTYLVVSLSDPSLSHEGRMEAYAKARKSRVRQRFHITDMVSAKRAACRLRLKTGANWIVAEAMDLVM